MTNNPTMSPKNNPRNDAPAEIDRVLEFWFGHGKTAIEVADEKTELWWSKNEQVDREIADQFAATSEAAASEAAASEAAASEAAANGELARWSESPRGLLALIICTDQFPRNMYRDTPRAFAYDSVALAYAKQCVDGGVATQLRPIERVFAYLPFEHSEELAEQERSIALYHELTQSVCADQVELFNGYLDFAQQHYEIIKRFGRYPHRNKILERESSDEELAFLQQPGSSF